MLAGAPPSVTYCSMASMKNTTIWLFGGMTETNEVHNGLYQLFIIDMQPNWRQVALRNAPGGRFGASLNAVGNHVYLYGGFVSKKAGTQNDLIVLATFEDPTLIPKWVRTFNMSGTPQSRAHFASSVVGRKVWVHGGYHVHGSMAMVDMSANHDFWYLDALPRGPQKGASCLRGYSRDSESADPCMDVGEFSQCVSSVFTLFYNYLALA